MTISGQSSAKLFRLGISQSIVLGFFLLLVISFVVSGFHFSGLNQFTYHFSSFQKTSASTNLMLKFDKDVAEFQRQILVFSYSDKITNTAQLILLHQQLIDDINELIAKDVSAQKHKTDLLNQIKSAIEGLSEKIDSLESQRRHRESIINNTLEDAFRIIDAGIYELFIQTEKKRSASSIQQLWDIEHHLDKAKTLSTRYFNKHDFKMKQDVLNSIQQVEKVLNSLSLLSSEPSFTQKIQSLLQSTAKTKQIFNQAVQADRNYLFLINVVLAGETSELSKLSEALRNIYLDQQQELIANTEQHSRFIKNFSIFSSIAGVFFATLIALFIINRIRVPLISITDTFSRLAQGENLQQIPGTDRVDEIGKLAQAANVFRQTNAHTQTLLVQAEEFTQQLKQREIDLEMAVKKAEAANVSKSQFLANMSHELRTPMNAILGMLLLLHKTELSAKQIEYIAKTEGAAKTLLSLLNDILDLSKAEAGKMELDPVAFNLDIFLRDLYVILSTSLGQKPVELRFNVDPNIPRYLLGDSLRLQQILINLGGNAIKFTQKGLVEIVITQNAISSDWVTLTFSVNDSGIGIAPENQQKIFSEFTQAESSTTRRFGGTGLGLAISQRLLSLMGGKLTLQSAEGVGSQFSFTIQLPRLSTEQITKLHSINQNTSTEKNNNRLVDMKILLVEDNLTNQQIALELLQTEGAIVEVANNGQEALDFLTHHLQRDHSPGVDIILMDLQMPIMDGITTTQKIRQELHLHDLPIIAMTANAMKSDREACLNVGMNEHVGKPFNLQDLITTLRTQVGWSALEITKETETTNTPEPIQVAEIDVAGAVARMGGNKSLYLKMLPKFLDNINKLSVQLKSLLAVGDIPSITRELHSLKGLSATMGATQLSEEIARMEKTLKHNPNHPDAASMVKTACELIENNIASITQIMESKQ